MSDFKFLKNKTEPTTRFRSNKQEKKLAKKLGGNTTINSGATFSQNDVVSPIFEVEAKTTNKNSFALSVNDLHKCQERCSHDRIPIMVIEFEKLGSEYAVIELQTLLSIIK
jgi:hypothetical protein